MHKLSATVIAGAAELESGGPQVDAALEFQRGRSEAGQAGAEKPGVRGRGRCVEANAGGRGAREHVTGRPLCPGLINKDCGLGEWLGQG